MTFSEPQVKRVGGKLDGKHVRTRELRGRMLSYVEGWHVVEHPKILERSRIGLTRRREHEAAQISLTVCEVYDIGQLAHVAA